MRHGVAHPLQRLADARADADRDDPAVGFHDVRGVRFLEEAEPAEGDAPRGGPGVDPAHAVVRPHLVDALLVLVPLFLRDQQLGQGPVDAFHQGVGGQPGAQHQLAGAVQQPLGLPVPAAASGAGVGPASCRLSCAAPAGACFAGAGTTRTRSVRPVGNGSPSGRVMRPRDASSSAFSTAARDACPAPAARRAPAAPRGTPPGARRPGARKRTAARPGRGRCFPSLDHDASLGGSHQSASSTITGAWSEAPLPLRSSRSIIAPVTRAARAGEARMKSIRIPSFFGKRSWV